MCQICHGLTMTSIKDSGDAHSLGQIFQHRIENLIVADPTTRQVVSFFFLQGAIECSSELGMLTLNHGTNVLILTILFITIHVSELSSMACKEEKQIVSGLGILHQPLHGLQDVLPGGCLMCHRPAAGLLGIRQDLQLWSPDFCMLQCNQDVLQGPNRSKENFQVAQHGHAVLAALVCRCYQHSLHHWRIFWHCRRCGDRLLVREGLHALIHPWHGAPVGLFESTTSGNLGLYQGIQFGLRQWPQSWICLQGFAHIDAVVAQDVDHPHGPDLLFEQLFFLSKKFFFGKHLGR
mmetsp:Transcript_22225/g.46156  ORF Transcript_22225/g.46156 Transcript_22225/m.46156 type:complete len:292 (+) Transcript_22225:517-1392(+)